MAAALANIEKKLATIQDMQQEMIDFLIQKEKADLKGNLNFLFDVFNNYKYNWKNAMYKNNNYIKILDIRQEAEKKIAFYREQIITKINKKSFMHSDQTVNKQLQAVQARFKDYQLGLYLLGFSSFLEVMLLENYDANYLSGISAKLDTHSLKYRELYSKCYDEIEGYALSSVQSSIEHQSNSIRPFIENIDTVNELYNKPIQLLVDKENLYFATIS